MTDDEATIVAYDKRELVGKYKDRFEWIARLASDAIDALHEEPIFPDVALKRLRSILKYTEV